MRNLVALLLLVFGLTGALAQTSTASIEVVGKYIVKAIPEEIRIVIPLIVEDSTYLECTDGLNRELGLLQTELKDKGLGTELVKTSNYSIRENFEYINGRKTLKGYMGSVDLRIQTQYDKNLLSEVMNVVRSQRQQFQISFILSETQKENLTSLAMEKAVLDAQRKARILTSASGVKMGKLKKISYGLTSYRTDPMTRALAYNMEDDSGVNELSLNPTENSITQTVQMVWEVVD